MEDFTGLAEAMAIEFASSSGANDRTGAFPAVNLESARSHGALGLTVPIDLGGRGANLPEFARYQERLARGDGATALVLAMHHMLIGGEAEAGSGRPKASPCYAGPWLTTTPWSTRPRRNREQAAHPWEDCPPPWRSRSGPTQGPLP